MPMSPTEFAEVLNSTRELMSELNTCLPARIVNYDAVTRMADVQPSIDKATADGRTIPAPIIHGVEVRWCSSKSAQAIISMPLAMGDGGMLHFCQRSLDEWVEGSRVPNDSRMHDLNDAFFVPGVDTSNELVPAEADCLLIKIGPAIIRMYQDGHGVLTLPAGTTLDSPSTVITGDVIIQKTLQVDMTIHANQQIKSDVEVTAKTVNLTTHTHAGVTPGNGQTGAPVA